MGENFRGSIGSENFAEKTFTDCLKQIIGGCGMPPNFAEKTFTDGSQTSKSAKVFSLESFPLCVYTYIFYPKLITILYLYTSMSVVMRLDALVILWAWQSIILR